MARGELKVNQAIQPAAPKIISRLDDIDRIILYLQDRTDKLKLSPRLDKLLENLQTTADLIRKYGSAHKVVPMLMKDIKISRATAYRYYSDSQQIFAATTRNDQKFHVDILLGQIEEKIREATLDKNHNAVAKLIREKRITIAELLGGAESELYEKLQLPRIRLGFYPELLNVEIPPEEELKAWIEKMKKPKRTANVSALDIEWEKADGEKRGS